MKNEKLGLILPKVNLLSSVTTLSKAAEAAMDFSSLKNDELFKKIGKKIFREELSRSRK